MKNPVESLLEDDHEALGQLLTELDGELAQHNSPRAFELLDLFWARLAIHIRAENLQLFPALDNARTSLFTGKDGLPTRNEAHDVLLQLRSDHDFFMKELAQTIKAMREIAGNQQAPARDLEGIRERMIIIKKRLETHNSLEEEQVYSWPSLLFDEPTMTKLRESVRRELENLPPRFG